MLQHDNEVQNQILDQIYGQGRSPLPVVKVVLILKTIKKKENIRFSPWSC